MNSIPSWQELESRADLVDLAPLGEASQSSLSKYSKPDDAQRAVQNVGAAFAFHTEREANPWWRLDLKDPYPVAWIVVHNRPRFEAKAASLVTEISQDGVDWRVLHRNPGIFGSGQGGDPLVIAVPEGMNVRFVRLSLEAEEMFHLSRVQAFASRNPGVCVAHRIDGLGARLLVMLNTMVFADRHNVDFKFTWPVRSAEAALHHAIESVESTFSSRFIAEHYLAELPHGILRPQGDDRVRIAAMLGSGRPLLLAAKNIQSQLRRLENDGRDSGFVKAFERIRFAPRLEDIRRAINAITLPPHPVAVHMRAGDIVYGDYRFSNEFTAKVISYPVARKILLDLLAEGRTPVLFSQDPGTGRLLAGEFGIPLGADLVAGVTGNELETAMAELFLMARCEGIFAGDSNFPIISAVVGAVPLVDPAARFGGRTQVEIIRDGMAGMLAAGVDGLQVAFARWSAVYYSTDDSIVDRVAYMEQAIANDPGNDFYRLIQAGLHFERGESVKADAILQDLYDRHADSKSFAGSGMRRFLRLFFTGTNPRTDTIVAPIRAGGEAGSHLGLYFTGLFQLVRKDTRGAKAWFRRLPQDGPPLKYC